MSKEEIVRATRLRRAALYLNGQDNGCNEIKTLRDLVEAAQAQPQDDSQPAAWGTMQPEFSDDDRTLITDKDEAETYNRQCYTLTPLFTRSDAGEVDRLNTVVEQQKNLIASLRAELRESHSITDDTLREELASRNEVIEMKAREVVEAQTAVTGWAAKCKAADQRNAELIAAIVSLPDEFKELSGCENTAGVYACIDYISDWVAELAKPTEAGESA